MANEYYERLSEMNPGELADGLAIEAELDAISQGFSKLPTPHTGGQGFDGPVRVGDAVNDDEAVNRGQLNAAIGEAVLLSIATYGNLAAAAWETLPSNTYLLFGTGAQFSNTPYTLVAESTYYLQVRHVIGGVGVSIYHDQISLASTDDAANADLRRLFVRTGATFDGAVSGGWVGFAMKKAALTALESLTPAADHLAYYTGAAAAALTALTPFARTMLDDVDAAGVRATLGLGAFAGKNRIINGKMEVAQRATSFVPWSNGSYSLDRWRLVWAGTIGAVVNAVQSTDVPAGAGFNKSLKVTVTTADASIAAGEVLAIDQPIEGYNVSDLVGKDFTVSFWMTSPKAGKHSVYLRNSDTDRSYITEVTVNAANTWEKKSFTVVGGLPASGSWNFNSGIGLVLGFALAAGANWQTATVGSWVAGSYMASTNQVNLLDVVGNVFGITGVQLEAGAVATEFEHRSYQEEVGRCRRYYVGYFAYNATQHDVTWVAWNVPLMANMRAIPTVVTGRLYAPTTGGYIATYGAWSPVLNASGDVNININGSPNLPGVGGWVKAEIVSMTAEL